MYCKYIFHFVTFFAFLGVSGHDSVCLGVTRKQNVATQNPDRTHDPTRLSRSQPKNPTPEMPPLKYPKIFAIYFRHGL